MGQGQGRWGGGDGEEGGLSLLRETAGGGSVGTISVRGDDCRAGRGAVEVPGAKHARQGMWEGCLHRSAGAGGWCLGSGGCMV